MQTLIVIFAAIAPVAIALGYIIYKDSVKREPLKWLVKGLWFGVLSAFVSFLFSVPAGVIFDLEEDPEVYGSFLSAFADAFLQASIPEELAKWIMLWLLLRRNPYFDEKFDGIVYSVCIGLGFAGLENVMYLFEGLDDGSWLSTGIARALFSIPGHFFFAVLMGYYYSIHYFGIDRGLMAKVKILAVPILAHGLYDAILMSMSVSEGLSIVCVVIFLYYFNKLRIKAQERIERLRNQ